VAVLVSRASILGALLLLAVDFGAFVAQLAVLHADWIHCVVIAALLGLLMYSHGPRRLALNKSSPLS